MFHVRIVSSPMSTSSVSSEREDSETQAALSFEKQVAISWCLNFASKVDCYCLF